MNADTVTIGPVRLSFCHLKEPAAFKGGEPKYSAVLLLPKTDTASMAAINAAVADARDYGIKAKWNGKLPTALVSAIRDGDGFRDDGVTPFGEECKGHWVITAKNKQQPILVDRNKKPIIDAAEVYSGCYAYANITFFPYSSGRNGISANLNQILKFMDGDRLAGSGVSTDEAFANVPAAAPAAPQAAYPGAIPTAAPAAYPAPQTVPTAAYPPPAAPPNPYAGQFDPLTGQPLGGTPF